MARRSEDGEDVFRPIVLLSGCHKNSGGEIGTSTRVLRDTSNCHLLWRHIFENLKHFILHDIGQRKKDNSAKSGKLVPLQEHDPDHKEMFRTLTMFLPQIHPSPVYTIPVTRVSDGIGG